LKKNPREIEIGERFEQRNDKGELTLMEVKEIIESDDSMVIISEAVKVV
jgi:hypothetical protein